MKMPAYLMGNDDIRYPLRKSTSQSILKSSSSFCGSTIPSDESKMNRTLLFSTLEIFEYDDSSLDYSSGGSVGPSPFSDSNSSHPQGRRGTVIQIQLDEYEPKKVRRRPRVMDGCAESRFQIWKKLLIPRNKIEKTPNTKKNTRKIKSITRQLLCRSNSAIRENKLGQRWSEPQIFHQQ